MKVLVLSVSTGQGHHATGKAIVKYIEEKGHQAKMVDAYRYINPALSESISKSYLMSTKYTPTVYGTFYRLAEKCDMTEKKVSLSRMANHIMSKAFASCITEYEPDVIVCTHVMAVQLLDAMREHDLDSRIKTVGIITDFTIHPYWEDTYLDYYITASELLNNQIRKKKIPLEKVRPFGIPIDEKFAQKITKREAREKLGIADKDTVLVMSGSMGYGNVIKHIRALDKLDMDFQMLIVCGNNKSLKKRMEELVTEKQVKIYGFVDNVDVMMDAADCIVTKPGGLSVSESLAKGLPMILMNPIPGQEDRNLEFLLNNGLGQFITETYPVDEAVFQLYHNSWRQENMSGEIRSFGKPYATRDLCEFILGLS